MGVYIYIYAIHTHTHTHTNTHTKDKKHLHIYTIPSVLEFEKYSTPLPIMDNYRDLYLYTSV